jgi:YesN/AraC family two-component response regulator
MSLIKDLRAKTEELSVLYVEDEEEIRKEVTLFLNKFFKKVLVASNGKDGLELFKEEPVDLVITDIKMPVMDGIGMLSEIKSLKPDMKTLLFTATEFIDKESLKIADGIISKPPSNADIIEEITNVLNRH